jgi:SAM-dependent methyltransferase
MKLEIGCGRTKAPGFVGMDRVALPEVDIVHELETFPWPMPNSHDPIPDSSISEIRASHVLEHVRDLNGVLEEACRILEPGGLFRIVVPYYRHEGAFSDPTHVRFFTERTFSYFTDGEPLNYYSKARFKIVSMKYGWNGRLAWHIEHHVKPARLANLAHKLLRNKRATLDVVLQK